MLHPGHQEFERLRCISAHFRCVACLMLTVIAELQGRDRAKSWTETGPCQAQSAESPSLDNELWGPVMQGPTMYERAWATLRAESSPFQAL